MAPLTSSERAIRARLGAHSLHAKYGGREITEAARTAANGALDARLLLEIDPDSELGEPERLRRLKHARKAHFSRLALKAAKVRRQKREVSS